MKRRSLLALLPGLAACTPVVLPMGPPRITPELASAHLVMADGARLPLRAWLPPAPPSAVVLGLHGFNEYARSFLEDPAPLFTARGIALYGIDQRGFGQAPNRGYWAGHETLATDAVTACALLRARHPGIPLVLMGESMGGAVAMLAATGETPLAADALVLLAPAVWGRNAMTGIMRFVLSLAAATIPAAILSGGVAGVVPTDNEASLIRWSRDPLILRQTRVDMALGLIDLMDAAVAAAPRLGSHGRPVLILYGGEDRLVPAGPTRAVLATLDARAPVTLGFYPTGHHQLLRDRGGAAVAADLLAWLAAPTAPLPSGASEAGMAWRALPA